MKRTLLTGTALATAAMFAASPALAELKISAYMDFQVSAGDDDNDADALAIGYAFATNSEIHFKGSGKTDAGLEYGFKIEVEGDSNENAGNPDNNANAPAAGNIDEAVVFVKGAFGKLTMGQDDCAADKEIDGCVNCTYGAMAGGQAGDLFGNLNTGTAKQEPALDEAGDDNMIMYTTPRIAGIQTNVSLMPADGTFQNLWGLNINTSHDLDGLGLKLNFTGVHASMTAPSLSANQDNELNGYNLGAALSYEGYKFEVGYMREHRGESTNGGDDDESFAIGAGYGQGPWEVGAGYSYGTEDVTDDQFEAWYLAGKYNIAKGLYTSVGATFAESTVGGAVAGGIGNGGNATDWWQATWALGMSF